MLRLNDLPKADLRGRPLEGVTNAFVSSVSLSIADHGCLTAWVHLRFDSGGCGFGGFKIGSASADNNRKPVSLDYAADWITRCCLVGGVERWEDLTGRPVRVLHEGLGGGVVAIGHLVRDEWFCPQVEWEKT